MDSLQIALFGASDAAKASSLLEVADLSSFQNDAPNTVVFIYGGAMITLMGLVLGVYWSRGFLCCFRIVCYLGAISTMTLAVKGVYTVNHFNFPKFVSCTHFLAGGMLCFGIMIWRKQSQGKPIAIPSMKQFWCMILPIALAFASSIAANNTALVHANAGFVEMIASAGPVCTVITSVAMGMDFGLSKLWPVLAVTAGMLLCATGEMHASMIGFCLAFYGALARSVKATLQHKLLDSHAADGDVKLDPIELLAWMCVPSLVVMFTWSIITEGLQPYVELSGENGLAISGSVLLTCFNACVLNVANLFVIADLGAVATQLCAQLKGILIILGGMAVFGESIAYIQILGFVMELAGVFWYNRVDEALKAAKKAGKSGSEASPLKA